MKLFVYCYCKIYTDYECSDENQTFVNGKGYNYTTKRFNYVENQIYLN